MADKAHGFIHIRTLWLIRIPSIFGVCAQWGRGAFWLYICFPQRMISIRLSNR